MPKEVLSALPFQPFGTRKTTLGWKLSVVWTRPGRSGGGGSARYSTSDDAGSSPVAVSLVAVAASGAAVDAAAVVPDASSLPHPETTTTTKEITPTQRSRGTGGIIAHARPLLKASKFRPVSSRVVVGVGLPNAQVDHLGIVGDQDSGQRVEQGASELVDVAEGAILRVGRRARLQLSASEGRGNPVSANRLGLEIRRAGCVLVEVSASIGSGDSVDVGRDTRREENEKAFRGGNAALRDAAKKIGLKADVPFMCECASIDCHGQVEVTTREWEAVAARPNHFLMIAGAQ